MQIEIPEDCPTTLADTITAMAKTAAVVQLKLDTGEELDVYLLRAEETDDHSVNVIHHPWVYSDQHGVRVGNPNYNVTSITPAALVQGITVY